MKRPVRFKQSYSVIVEIIFQAQLFSLFYMELICHSVGVSFFRHRESHYVQARFPQGECCRSATAVACSAVAGVPSRAAVVYDATASALVLYARHARAGLGRNGRYLGPTIRVWKGDDVKLIYSNRTAENVSMTVAGLLVPGPLMGGPARMMSPNADWAPVLPIRQSAATLWYHANTPNRTAQQVYNGPPECGWSKTTLVKRCPFRTITAWMIFPSLSR